MTQFEIGKKIYRHLSVTGEIVDRFRDLSCDHNPIHIDDKYAKKKGFTGRVVYGNILGLMISSLVGMDLGYPDVILISQNLNFKEPIYIGDTIELCATISNRSEAVRVIELDLEFRNSVGKKIATVKCQVKYL